MILGNEIVTGDTLANKINDFLTSITNEVTPLQPEPSENQFKFNEYCIEPQFIIDEESVFDKLSNISILKSLGSDGIPNCVLLPHRSMLRYSKNMLLPTVWKKAEVIPILKTSVPAYITTDVRPISLTPTLSYLVLPCPTLKTYYHSTIEGPAREFMRTILFKA